MIRTPKPNLKKDPEKWLLRSVLDHRDKRAAQLFAKRDYISEPMRRLKEKSMLESTLKIDQEELIKMDHELLHELENHTDIDYFEEMDQDLLNEMVDEYLPE